MMLTSSSKSRKIVPSNKNNIINSLTATQSSALLPGTFVTKNEWRGSVEFINSNPPSCQPYKALRLIYNIEQKDKIATEEFHKTTNSVSGLLLNIKFKLIDSSISNTGPHLMH